MYNIRFVVILKFGKCVKIVIQIKLNIDKFVIGAIWYKALIHARI